MSAGPGWGGAATRAEAWKGRGWKSSQAGPGNERVGAETNSICAGFVIERGRVTACAPILRKRLTYWIQLAVRIGD
jgi:hypothetical protein